MTSEKHAEQPRLCNECLSVAHSLAAIGKPDDRVIKRCPHNGVIAVGMTRGGIIRSWHAEGPLSDAQADAVGARLIDMFRRADMVDNTPTRQ
jgi:hypothetical protein